MRKTLIIVLAIAICTFFAVSLYAEVNTLNSISDLYGPVKFDHSKHTTIAGNCGSCHHQHGNSSSLPCKECHSLTPETFRNSVNNMFMPCKNCHGDADPGSPAMPSLKVAYHSTCFQCHRGMGNIGLDPKGCTEMCHAKKGN